MSSGCNDHQPSGQHPQGTLPFALDCPGETAHDVGNGGDGYTGTIPSQYGVLTDLVALKLGLSSITGSIPTQVCVLNSRRSGALHPSAFLISSTTRTVDGPSYFVEKRESEGSADLWCSVELLGSLFRTASRRLHHSNVSAGLVTFETRFCLIHLFPLDFSSELGMWTALTWGGFFLYSSKLGGTIPVSSVPSRVGLHHLLTTRPDPTDPTRKHGKLRIWDVSAKRGVDRDHPDSGVSTPTYHTLITPARVLPQAHEPIRTALSSGSWTR